MRNTTTSANIRAAIGAASILAFVACASAGSTRPDFNGDSFDDLAIPVPGEAIGVISNAGAVNVVYGTADGLKGASNQIWHKNRPGILGSCEVDDAFGTSVAWGDFDNDSFVDLAIGASGDGLAGAVFVLYGTAKGLTGENSDRWRMGVDGVPGTPEANGIFGAALATGDFDNDGFDDLAVGAPGDTLDGDFLAGSVIVLRGGVGGLRTIGAQIWNQDSGGIPGTTEFGDAFGIALCAADFNGDSRDDLAIGAFADKVGDVEAAGSVHVLYGSSIGLRSADNEVWNQDVENIADVAQSNDAFGASLTSGDFNNDGFSDLAIGAPLESLGSNVEAGVVHVFYGGLDGLSEFRTQLWSQATAGVADGPETEDDFGLALAAGDFDNDGRDDLAIGVPGESFGIRENAGAVHVLYGTVGGLSADDSQFWTQNSTNILDAQEMDDRFGSLLIAANFDGDNFFDLAIGVPDESIGSAIECGAVHVLYGSLGSGLESEGNQFWHQNRGNIRDDCESGDKFGLGLD